MRPETEAAIAAAQIAQRIADSREGAEHITSKGGIDLVTATDVACEDAIRAELLRRFPNYPVIGEERGGTAIPGQPYWLVDPICGTRSFVADLPLYCTNIALVENATVTTAAVAVGKTGEVLYAEKGRGTRMLTRDRDVAVSANPANNMIWFDGKGDLAAKTVRSAMLCRHWYVCMFPSSVTAAYVAIGRLGALIQFGMSVPSNGLGSVHWSAGCLAAAEAGAIVTDLDTHCEWTFNTRNLLITASRTLHDELLDLVVKAGQSPA